MASGPLAQYVRTRDVEAFAEVVTQYQSLVFATCRRQLSNPADVEDAVQETFLRLAQKASQLHTNLGAWLHTCAVNVSIDINRRRQSRARHETAAALNSTAASDAERAIRDLREHLDVALQKLSASQRELIIERFFMGTPQVEMAARAGVTPSTISHHLDRAIEALRTHLRAMGCVGLTGSAAALLGALHAEHSSAAVPQALTANLMKIGLSGVGAGASVSVAGWLIGIAALVLVAVGCWIVWGQVMGPSSVIVPGHVMAASGPQNPATLPSGQAITVNAQQRSGTMQPDWKSAQSNARSGVLAGRVVDEGGKPVAGAVLTLMGLGSASSRSDAGGYYSFRALPRADGTGKYTVMVRAEGYPPIQSNGAGEPALQLSASSQARRDFVLRRGMTVNVVTTDAQNHPLPDVRIEATKVGGSFRDRLMFESGGTGRQGRTDYILPVGQGAYCLLAWIGGYAPQRIVINPTSADPPLSLTIAMQPGLNIRGIAICSDRKPAAGYRISAKPDWWNSPMIGQMEKVGADGSFTLTTVGAGDYTLMAWTEHSGRAITTIHLPPTAQPIRLDLPFPSQASLAKATGHIHIHGAIPSDAPLMWLNARAIPASGDRSLTDDVDVDFGPPVLRRLRRAVKEGTYTISASPGTYRIVFDSPYTKPLTLEDVHLPGPVPDITVEMVGQPHLTGMVTDAVSGKPVTHFAVRIRKVDNPGGGGYVQDDQWTQVSDRNGHFDMVCIGAGQYEAEVSAPGYAWKWSSPVSVDGTNSSEEMQIRLIAGGSLTGTVLDESGKAVAGAKVVPLSMAMGLGWRDADEFMTDAGAVLTDSGGHFVLPHLQSGSETIKITDPDYSPLVVSDLKVVEGESATVPTITFGRGGSIAGTVYDSLGKPLANVGVILDNSSDRGGQRDTTGHIASTVTDQNGHYHFDHLPTQVMWADLQDLWERQGVIRRVVRPVDGVTAHLDFGGQNQVRGRLVDKGKPLAHCDLKLAAGSLVYGDVAALISTDADGKFVFYGPPVGKYTLFAETQQAGARDRYLREVEVGEGPVDLGNVEYDCGDVIIKMAFDDPAIASSQKWVRVAERFPSILGQRFGAETVEEGDHLRASGVPAGHFVVLADIQALDGMFAVPFEQGQNGSPTTVVFRIPKPTAKLELIDSNPGKTRERPDVVELQNEEGTVEAMVGGFAKGSSLPPGVYHIVDWLSHRPMSESPRIVLREGETTTIKEDFSQLLANGDVGAKISVWRADGVLDISSTIRLLDKSGAVVAPVGIDDFATVFAGPPGDYRAEISRPGETPVFKDVEFPPSSAPGPGKRLVPVYLVLP